MQKLMALVYVRFLDFHSDTPNYLNTIASYMPAALRWRLNVFEWNLSIYILNLHAYLKSFCTDQHFVALLPISTLPNPLLRNGSKGLLKD